MFITIVFLFRIWDKIIGGSCKILVFVAVAMLLTLKRPILSMKRLLDVEQYLSQVLIQHSLTHSLIWHPSRVADTPPLLPISRYGYRLFVADVCLCSEVLQPGGSWSSSGSGSM